MTRLAGSLVALSVAALVTVAAPAASGGSGAEAIGGLSHPLPAPPSRPTSLAGSCSSVALDNGGVTVFGANYDDSYWDDGLVFFNKRGVVKTSLFAGTTGARAHWVSRYASITFSLLGFGYAWAGMNDRGLIMSTMSLRSTIYPRPDARPPLDSGEWMQYVLDTCATIEEVIATDPVVRILTVDHYLVADGRGNAAAVEFLGGRMVVHSGAEMPAPVLTNSTYDTSVQTWLSFRQAGNTDYWSLNRSLHRFCLAADRADAFRPCDAPEAVDYAFETLQRVAGEKFGGGTSQWSIVFDTASARVWFRTVRNPDIRFVELVRFDPWCTGPVQMLDIHAGSAGDVAGSFSDYSHETNIDHMRWCLLDREIPFTEEGLLWTVRYLEAFPCQRWGPPRRHLRHEP